MCSLEKKRMDKRSILTEFILLYRDLPCLWDTNCEGYKHSDQRTAAWDRMLEKYRELEPDATVAAVKKKIDNIRTAYKREVKKVIESKKPGHSSSDVYRPNLWYYEMLSFLEKDEPQTYGIDPLSITRETSDDVSDHEEHIEIRREARVARPQLKRKKHILVDNVKNQLLVLKQNTPKLGNSFGTYVGEQLECMPTLQRHIAEKLIAEVIFLAKTENLNFDSRIETPSASVEPIFPSHTSSCKTTAQHSPLQQFIKSSPPYEYNVSCCEASPNQSLSNVTTEMPSSPHFQEVQFSSQVQSSSVPIQKMPTIKLPLSPQYLSSHSALFSPHPCSSSPDIDIQKNKTSTIISPSSSNMIQELEKSEPNIIDRQTDML